MFWVTGHSRTKLRPGTGVAWLSQLCTVRYLECTVWEEYLVRSILVHTVRYGVQYGTSVLPYRYV